MPRRRYSRKKKKRSDFGGSKARDGWLKQAQQAPVVVRRIDDLPEDHPVRVHNS